ncbi:hypothetical protein [Streptomyces sp. BBFR102]
MQQPAPARGRPGPLAGVRVVGRCEVRAELGDDPAESARALGAPGP